MKLEDLNDMLSVVIGKYAIRKNKINKDISTGNPDKTELPDRSGNQYAIASSDPDVRDFVGGTTGLKDKPKPKNLVRPTLH